MLQTQRYRAHTGVVVAVFALALAALPQACSLNAEGELFGNSPSGDAPGGTSSGGGSSAMSGSSGGLSGGGATSSAGPGGSSTGGGAGSGGAGGAGGNAGGAGGAGGVGGEGGSVGQGGAANLCGNGMIDAGEECDDANPLLGDGCDLCQVNCMPVTSYEEPVTHHCYYFSVATATWDGAKLGCEAMGYYLAMLTTQAEIDYLKGVPSTDLWIGASKTAGNWVWLNGEPVNPAFWEMGQPDGAAEFCVELGSVGDGNDAGLLNDYTCTTVQAYLCEWSPPGMP